MKLVFTVTAKASTKTLAEVKGVEVDGSLSVQDITENVIKTEQFLERITGRRWHINVEQITTND